MKIIIVVAAVLLTFMPSSKVCAESDLDLVDQKQKEKNSIRKRLFERLTYTRSWEMGMWRLKFGDETPEAKVQLEKSMVAYAFNYWVLSKKKVIDPVPAFEMQIRNSFLLGDIQRVRLNEPLSPPYGIAGPKLTESEYKSLAHEFKSFFSPK